MKFRGVWIMFSGNFQSSETYFIIVFIVIWFAYPDTILIIYLFKTNNELTNEWIMNWQIYNYKSSFVENLTTIMK